MTGAKPQPVPPSWGISRDRALTNTAAQTEKIRFPAVKSLRVVYFPRIKS